MPAEGARPRPTLSCAAPAGAGLAAALEPLAGPPALWAALAAALAGLLPPSRPAPARGLLAALAGAAVAGVGVFLGGWGWQATAAAGLLAVSAGLGLGGCGLSRDPVAAVAGSLAALAGQAAVALGAEEAGPVALVGVILAAAANLDPRAPAGPEREARREGDGEDG